MNNCGCCLHLFIPGHPWVLQFCCSLLTPTQSAPPCGTGFEHVRVRVWNPPPHDAEHWLHADQSDHPPST